VDSLTMLGLNKCRMSNFLETIHTTLGITAHCFHFDGVPVCFWTLVRSYKANGHLIQTGVTIVFIPFDILLNQRLMEEEKFIIIL
jgi:hypothetical protein